MTLVRNVALIPIGTTPIALPAGGSIIKLLRTGFPSGTVSQSYMLNSTRISSIMIAYSWLSIGLTAYVLREAERDDPA